MEFTSFQKANTRDSAMQTQTRRLWPTWAIIPVLDVSTSLVTFASGSGALLTILAPTLCSAAVVASENEPHQVKPELWMPSPFNLFLWVWSRNVAPRLVSLWVWWWLSPLLSFSSASSPSTLVRLRVDHLELPVIRPCKKRLMRLKSWGAMEWSQANFYFNGSFPRSAHALLALIWSSFRSVSPFIVFLPLNALNANCWLPCCIMGPCCIHLSIIRIYWLFYLLKGEGNYKSTSFVHVRIRMFCALRPI